MVLQARGRGGEAADSALGYGCKCTTELTDGQARSVQCMQEFATLRGWLATGAKSRTH